MLALLEISQTRHNKYSVESEYSVYSEFSVDSLYSVFYLYSVDSVESEYCGFVGLSDFGIVWVCIQNIHIPQNAHNLQNI